VTRVPPISVRDALALLLVYRIDHDVRERGEHSRFRHRDGRATTLVEHDDRPISPTLVRLMAADLEMTVEDFLRQL